MLENKSINCDIYSEFSVKERQEARKQIIENILGTDMGRHASLQNEVKALSETPAEARNLDGANKIKLMNAMVHAVDIGNPSRKFDIAESWAKAIIKEFFHQGDLERNQNIEITMLCDRSTVNLAGAQIGFINFVVKPYMQFCSVLVPKLAPFVDQCALNVEEYIKLKDKYEKLMKEGNIF